MMTYLRKPISTRTWEHLVFENYVKAFSKDGLLASDMVSWRKYLPIEIEEEKDPDDDLFY